MAEHTPGVDLEADPPAEFTPSLEEVLRTYDLEGLSVEDQRSHAHELLDAGELDQASMDVLQAAEIL